HGSGGDQEPRGGLERFRGLARCHLLQPQRTPHLTAPFFWWVLSLAGLAVSAGEWLRTPSRSMALATIVLALVTLALKRRAALFPPLIALAIAIGAGQLRLERLAG